jgi:dihydropteroate synthase
MLSLRNLADLYNSYSELINAEVAPVVIGDQSFSSSGPPVIMGTVNLSRDSTYRESIAINAQSAIRKAMIMSAQGAQLIDIGAESSTAKAARVSADDQARVLVPIIEELTSHGIAISAETYEPSVVKACLDAGAQVLNFTGTAHQEEILELAGAANASVILCYVGGANVREITDVDINQDPLPGLIDYFADRIEVARKCGVTNIILDPGMGFYYGNLVVPSVRVKHQAKVILNSFRLRELGYPICQALPHAFDLFEDEFRTAEGFFAVIAQLGGVNVMRTHEVARVEAVIRSMNFLSQN